MENLTFVSGNKNKVLEFEEILGFKLQNEPLDLIEIQSINVEEVSKYKLIDAYNKLQKPVIIEDTGVYMEELNGFPGALIKYYFNGIGDYRLCEFYGNTNIKAETVIGYYDGENMEFFKGEVNGVIADIPRGDNGFGWDNIFIPNDQEHKTFAEMSSNEKNLFSMRKKALDKLKFFLVNKNKMN